MARYDEERRNNRPDPAEWMLEDHARGIDVSAKLVRMRAMALNADYPTCRALERSIRHKNERRTELARRKAPAKILTRYSEEISILSAALSSVEGRIYERYNGSTAR